MAEQTFNRWQHEQQEPELQNEYRPELGYLYHDRTVLSKKFPNCNIIMLNK